MTIGWKTALVFNVCPYRHEEDGHVEHGGDAECDLLAGLGRDEENKESEDVDEDAGLDIVKQKEKRLPPDDEIIGDMNKRIFAAWIKLLSSRGVKIFQFVYADS